MGARSPQDRQIGDADRRLIPEAMETRRKSDVEEEEEGEDEAKWYGVSSIYPYLHAQEQKRNKKKERSARKPNRTTGAKKRSGREIAADARVKRVQGWGGGVAGDHLRIVAMAKKERLSKPDDGSSRGLCGA